MTTNSMKDGNTPDRDGALPQADRAVVNGAASVSAVPASVPSAEIDAFCEALTKPLEPIIRKFCDDVYGTILDSVQDHLRENAVFNIQSAFDAGHRQIQQAYAALRAVKASLDIVEANNNAHACLNGFWSQERADYYHAQAIEAQWAETERLGATHESAVRQDASEASQGTPA